MRLLSSVVVATALCIIIGPANAAPPPPLNSDVYGRLPNIERMEMSPSGERIAYVAVDGDHRRLTVKSLAGDTLYTVAAGDLKVRSIAWGGDDHLLLTLSMAQGLFGEVGEYRHTLVINIASRKIFTVFDNNPTIFNATFGCEGIIAREGHRYGFFRGLTLHKSRGFEPSFNSKRSPSAIHNLVLAEMRY